MHQKNIISPPWLITATFNLPKIKINQNSLVNSANTSAVINDLKNQIITEGVNIKNCELGRIANVDTI